MAGDTATAPVLRRVEDGVAWITLNRPDAGNAINTEMREQLIAWLEEASADLAVRAVVLSGAGEKGFCTGADLRSPLPGPARPAGAPDRTVGDAARMIRDGWQRLITAVLDCEKPVVAAVNATAAGGGLSLALACDLVLAAEGASFIAVFVRRGIAPDAGAVYLLTRLVGPQRAKELCFFGDGVSARDAERLGLVNRVVGADELSTVASEWAGRPGHRPDQGHRHGQVPGQPGARLGPDHRPLGGVGGPGAGHRQRRLPGGARRLRPAPSPGVQGLVIRPRRP